MKKKLMKVVYEKEVNHRVTNLVAMVPGRALVEEA